MFFPEFLRTREHFAELIRALDADRLAPEAFRDGKALLAALADDQVRRILHKTGLEKFTDKTLVNPEKLFSELAEVRARSWAPDDEEHTVGMRCIAALIFNEHGEAVAGLSISALTVRMSDERIGELGPKVRRAAAQITQSISGHVPDM